MDLSPYVFNRSYLIIDSLMITARSVADWSIDTSESDPIENLSAI